MVNVNAFPLFPASAGYILTGCNAGVLLLQGGEAGKRFRAILPGVLLAQLVGLRTVGHPARDRPPVGNAALIAGSRLSVKTRV